MEFGIDIGGTFTDFVVSDNGALRIYKSPSTPHAPEEALLAGLLHLTGGNLSALTHVAHGSTVATNAILERKGAKIAFLVTEGFQDLLWIGRQNRPKVYALHPTIPAPLVARKDSYGIHERLDHRGNVLVPLDAVQLDRVLDALSKEKYEAIAVCLLYSFLNPEHEQFIRERLVTRGIVQAWQVALSHEVLPEFREYERASTVALEAYVRPMMARYVGNLRAQLPAHVALRMMKSDGGILRAEQVAQRAVLTAMSGLSAGVTGAFAVAKQAGITRIITLDMGGTSTDVALCDGDIPIAPHSQIDQLPLRARLVDVETIGAGGGSLVRIDAGGALRVGPQSAGAQPGAVIYGRGGTIPTVSDANALLGRLDAQHFLGGAMPLDLDSAQQAFKPLAQQLGTDAYSVARGVITIANTHLDRAIRRVSVARGHDPRHFVLVAFGGAGGLHACEVAQGLGMTRVLIPRYAGVLCALGLLLAEVRVDHSRPVLTRATRQIIAQLRATQAELLAVGRDDLRQEGLDDAQMTFKVSLDMRYQGQAYELNVPFEGDVVRLFHRLHERTYGHSDETREVEIVTMRLQAVGSRQTPSLPTYPLGATTEAHSALIAHKPTPDGEIACYEREKLQHGMTFKGRALVFQTDSTTYIPQGWRVEVDAFHNLIATHLTDAEA